MHIKVLAIGVLTVAGLMPSAGFAGEAKVTWQNPQDYTDIVSDDGPQQAFQDSLFTYLDGEFARQAKRLPEGSVLNVTVTNFDMAGRAENGVREIQALWYPQMTVNYQLLDATGAVSSEQQGMVYAQQDYYNANSAMRQSEQNATSNEFYFEDAMVRQWFYDTCFEKHKSH